MKTQKRTALAGVFAALAVFGVLCIACKQPDDPGSGNPALPGTVSISPNTGVTAGTELTAAYSGSETVSYQWKKDGTNVGTNSNKFTPTEAGSYTVTVSAAGYQSKTSAAVTVTAIVVDPNLPTPVAGDYTFGNLTQTAGSVTAVTVTANAGKSPGAVTVLYNGSQTIPQTAGTYPVTFNVAAATGWNAAAGLSAGTLTVNAVANPNLSTPVAGDYTFGNLTQTAGSVTAVTVTANAGKSPGAVTVLYNGSQTIPQTAGTYPVTFNVAAATGWNAASGLSAGTLTVNAVANPNLPTPVAADYTFGNLTQTAGSVTAVTVTANAGKSPGAITVLYNGALTIPQTAGSYPVTFNVAAATGWNAASGLAAGTLTVREAATGPQTTLVRYWLNQNNEIAFNPGTATLTAGQTMVLSAGGAGYTDHRWYFNGQAIPGQTGESFTFDSAGRTPGRYIIGLLVEKDGAYYSANFTFTVQ